jgi:hypothetical protein
MTRDEREAFLAAMHVGILTVDEPGRGPLSVPVWYGYEAGGEIVVVARPEARKARLSCAGARDVKPIVRKYLGADVGDACVDATRPNGTNEIVVRIRPERWYSRDFAKPS